jgi:hypothetical protein
MTGRLNVFYIVSTWHERVAHWHSNGLSAEAYCCDHEFGLERLKYQACRVERAASGPQLLPVHISVPSTTAVLELRSPSGWSMRMDPARWLADTPDRLPTCPNSKINSLLPCGLCAGLTLP